LDDFALSRIHFDRGHSLFVLARSEAEGPDGGFTSTAFGRIGENTMSQRPTFQVQFGAGEEFADGPLTLTFGSGAILDESESLNIRCGPRKGFAAVFGCHITMPLAHQAHHRCGCSAFD
jgi:hypothetical protein